MSGSANLAEHAAAEAMVRHHQVLAATLDRHVADLIRIARVGSAERAWRLRDDLVAWLRDEMLPHTLAEEAVLYPAAARQGETRLLIRGLLSDHLAIAELATELSEASTPVAAAADARGLQAVFAAHLAKENDLIVPVLVAADDVSLASLLQGVHVLIGGDHTGSRDGGAGALRAAVAARESV